LNPVFAIFFEFFLLKRDFFVFEIEISPREADFFPRFRILQKRFVRLFNTLTHPDCARKRFPENLVASFRIAPDFSARACSRISPGRFCDPDSGPRKESPRAGTGISARHAAARCPYLSIFSRTNGAQRNSAVRIVLPGTSVRKTKMKKGNAVAFPLSGSSTAGPACCCDVIRGKSG
jgi:hypothetical protein